MVPLHPRWQRASVQRRYKVQFRFLHTASQEGMFHVPVKLSKPLPETVSRRWFIVSKRLGSLLGARRRPQAAHPRRGPADGGELSQAARAAAAVRAAKPFSPVSHFGMIMFRVHDARIGKKYIRSKTQREESVCEPC